METQREDKIREREKFVQMMLAIRQEDELKERLRRENLKATKSTLEKQMQMKRE
jgi:hypothetical protein